MCNLLHVIVDPSHEYFFGRKLLQVSQSFTRQSQHHQTWLLLQVDLGEQANLNTILLLVPFMKKRKKLYFQDMFSESQI